MSGIRNLFSLLLVFFLCLAGCGKKQPEIVPGAEAEHTDHAVHKHEELPETLAEAVEELAEHRDELAAAYQAGDVKSADLAMHHVTDLADAIKGLAAKTSLDRYEQSDATTAAEQIGDVIFTLHEAMGGHGANAKVDYADYEKEADSLSDAIANLQAIVAKLPAKSE